MSGEYPDLMERGSGSSPGPRVVEGEGAATGRLAIFIDGGYPDRLARDVFGVRPDYRRLNDEITAAVRAGTAEAIDLLRTFYYHCPPYQGNPPTEQEAERFARTRAFYQALRRLPRFEVREGCLAFRGTDAAGSPIFQQKRVDLQLGLDFALLAGKRQISHAALLSGDSDLIPAVAVAKQEGVSVWLVHGPRRSAEGKPTYAQDLWDAADERVELDEAFMGRVSWRNAAFADPAAGMRATLEARLASQEWESDRFRLYGEE